MNSLAEFVLNKNDMGSEKSNSARKTSWTRRSRP